MGLCPSCFHRAKSPKERLVNCLTLTSEKQNTVHFNFSNYKRLVLPSNWFEECAPQELVWKQKILFKFTKTDLLVWEMWAMLQKEDKNKQAEAQTLSGTGKNVSCEETTQSFLHREQHGQSTRDHGEPIDLSLQYRLRLLWTPSEDKDVHKKQPLNTHKQKALVQERIQLEMPWVLLVIVDHQRNQGESSNYSSNQIKTKISLSRQLWDIVKAVIKGPFMAIWAKS